MFPNIVHELYLTDGSLSVKIENTTVNYYNQYFMYYNNNVINDDNDNNNNDIIIIMIYFALYRHKLQTVFTSMV